MHTRTFSGIGLYSPCTKPLLSSFGHLLLFRASPFGSIFSIWSILFVLFLFFLFLHILTTQFCAGAEATPYSQAMAPRQFWAFISILWAAVIIEPAEGAHQLTHIPTFPKWFGHHFDLKKKSPHNKFNTLGFSVCECKSLRLFPHNVIKLYYYL